MAENPPAPRPEFFAPGEVVLLFAPPAGQAGGAAPRRGRIESLAAAFETRPDAGVTVPPEQFVFLQLQTALGRRNVNITGIGPSLAIRRGNTHHVMQTVYLDGRRNESHRLRTLNEQEREQLTSSVREAVEALNATILNQQPLPPVTVGGYQLVAASPNWLASPFTGL